MKILTLNTHSLQEEHYAKKLDAFLEFILRERPDLIALQEVNQSTDTAPAHGCAGMVSLPGIDIPLRGDNHALQIALRLEAEGVPCSWAWLPIKLGYGKYDEGVALLTLHRKIAATDVCTISRICDYANWRTRKVLGVQVEGCADWFYSVHMGWWQDRQEPFLEQWNALNRHLSGKKAAVCVWLLGDFNSPAELRGQGYDLIAASGWQDTYLLAGEKDDGLTVEGVIDGWRGQREMPVNAKGMRIDHIWCSGTVPVGFSRVVFNGKYGPVISDHFGVLVETKGKTDYLKEGK